MVGVTHVLMVALDRGRPEQISRMMQLNVMGPVFNLTGVDVSERTACKYGCCLNLLAKSGGAAKPLPALFRGLSWMIGRGEIQLA